MGEVLGEDGRNDGWEKKPKQKHAMKYGFVLPLSGIERAIEQLVEYAHIAKEEGRKRGVFLENYINYWGV